jgi:hypothetical protein
VYAFGGFREGSGFRWGQGDQLRSLFPRGNGKLLVFLEYPAESAHSPFVVFLPVFVAAKIRIDALADQRNRFPTVETAHAGEANSSASII